MAKISHLKFALLSNVWIHSSVGPSSKIIPLLDFNIEHIGLKIQRLKVKFG